MPHAPVSIDEAPYNFHMLHSCRLTSSSMGKPSFKSRKSAQKRKMKRQTRLIKQKEEEVGDLQIQMQEIQNFINDKGKKAIDGLNKCSQENDNLVKWLKIYDEQIKNQEKEIYNLNLKLYFSQSTQPHPQPQPRSQPQPQPQSQQSQTYKSMDDYFKSQ